MDIYSCKICNKFIKNAALLGRHLHYFHKDITKEEYYRTYICSSNGCVVCGNPTKFLDLGKGFVSTCSASCATKLQWKNDDGSRLEKATERLVENNIGIPGARKGCKNKGAYPMTDSVLNRVKNNPPPSWSGKRHKESTRQKMSDTRLALLASGEITIMASYKGKFQPQNPQKYRGDPTNIIYRSRWELVLMSSLDKHPDVLAWSSEETRIPYISPIDRKIHSYYPDFWVKKKNASDGKIVDVLIEVKPKAQCQPPKVLQKPNKRYITEVQTWGINSAKWKAAEYYCKERGWQFQIMTEDDLGIKY